MINRQNQQFERTALLYPICVVHLRNGTRAITLPQKYSNRHMLFFLVVSWLSHGHISFIAFFIFVKKKYDFITYFRCYFRHTNQFKFGTRNQNRHLLVLNGF